MGYPGAWGRIIHEKILKSKILWHCPFKELLLLIFRHESSPVWDHNPGIVEVYYYFSQELMT